MTDRIIRNRLCLFFLLLSGLVITGPAPAESQALLISGQALDAKSSRGVKGLQIINTRTIQRFYGDSSGNFLIQTAKNDTLFFTAPGYAGFYRSYRDSALRTIYTFSFKMNRLSYELPEVQVQSARDFEKVTRDAQRLGFRLEDYMITSPADIASHPLTYLYQLLSKREKDKREYAVLSNEARKNALLHELMLYYIDFGILEIPANQVDAFLDHCLITEVFLKNATEYEFIRYLKDRERSFLRLHPLQE